MSYGKGCLRIFVEVGDLVEFPGDAIVNPANTLLIMSGGVAGAIKRKGGEVIEQEARRYAPIKIGEAVVTSAGRLKAKYVVHAPTVVEPGGSSNPDYVRKATLAALRKCAEVGAKTVAFPLMGAGVGGLSIRESVSSMVSALEEFGDCSIEVHLVVLNEDVRKEVERTLEDLGWNRPNLGTQA